MALAHFVRLLTLLAGCASATVSSSADASSSTTTRGNEAGAGQKPRGIVIVAQGRSGSTMLGETFRQNKEALYWYEPCRSWGEGRFSSSSQYHRELHGEECAGLVRRLARCEFTPQDSARLGVDPAALDSGSPGLAPLRLALDAPSADALARAHQALLDTCRESRAVVVKTIRADAGVGSDDGILVVHLVRDPRAVIHSQIKTFNVAHKYRRYFGGQREPPLTGDRAGGAHTGSNATQVQLDGDYMPWGGKERAHALGLIVCGVYRNQLDSSATLGEGRYLRVRYEDIASSPESTVKHIYDWAGLGALPPRVSIWLNENTRLPDCEEAGRPVPDDAAASAPEGVAWGHRATTEHPAYDGTGTEGGLARTNAGVGKGSASVAVPAGVAESEAAAAAWAAAVASPNLAARRMAAEEEANGLGGGPGLVRGHRRQLHQRVNCEEMMAQQAEWDRYGTRRHAATMAGLWRTQMPKEEANVVWEACAESGVLEEMGYTQDGSFPT